MKIGLVHLGLASAGTSLIVRPLIDGLAKQGETVFGLEYNKFSKRIELNDLTVKNSTSQLSSNRNVLTSFPIEAWNEHTKEISEELSALDKIIVLGGNEAKNISFTANHLYVPVSIFNNIKGNQFTLGYDTALNSIVECIESVRDTASSLLYGKVRLFNIQIPGQGVSALLTNSALAVEAEVVDNVSEEKIAQLKEHIRNKEANDETYTFFLMNESVDPNALAVHFQDFDLDWKVVEIEESQCGGPYPTAIDRLLANQLKKAVLEWTLSNQPSGQLLIQEGRVLFDQAVKVN
ncbi:hypothetical protein CHH83_00630 [Bacillus sp. 7586-K]|nr:hypothetical protein CHH83_00630 [Bacillus sp. 7586-K]